MSQAVRNLPCMTFDVLCGKLLKTQNRNVFVVLMDLIYIYIENTILICTVLFN